MASVCKWMQGEAAEGRSGRILLVPASVVILIIGASRAGNKRPTIWPLADPYVT
jgi:hypothetical protein